MDARHYSTLVSKTLPHGCGGHCKHFYILILYLMLKYIILVGCSLIINQKGDGHLCHYNHPRRAIWHERFLRERDGKYHSSIPAGVKF